MCTHLWLMVHLWRTLNGKRISSNHCDTTIKYSCMYDLTAEKGLCITRIVFIALRVAFLFVQKVLFNSRDLGLSFFPWNLPSVFTVVLLSFPEWDFVCLCLAGIQRCRTCLKLLRCAAGCFHWTAGEPLEIPPKKHKALLMPLTSFFLTLTLPKSSAFLQSVLFSS